MDDDADLVRRIERLSDLVNGDPWLVHRGRFVTLELRLDLGAVLYHVAIDRGRIAAVARGPFLMRAWGFAVRGSAEGWRQFWRPVPPPHHHDIFALQKLGAFRIEGDLQPLMANLLYFKDVLAAPRRGNGDTAI
ncbi:MAG TPA: hypothetical protein VMU87_10010 [Stellaceae bacterium]|nr:hypothetical protein [Stellaceae bacterium]